MHFKERCLRYCELHPKLRIYVFMRSHNDHNKKCRFLRKLHVSWVRIQWAPDELCESDTNNFMSYFTFSGLRYWWYLRNRNFLQTTLSILLGAFPDTMSTKTWTHFVQLINTDKFCQFNYGFKSTNREKYGMDNPPCYNLVKVSAPIVMFWGQNDIFVKPQVCT